MSSRLVVGWAVGISVLLVQRPLTSPDFWWDLSRGREVVSGTFSPARELLSLEIFREADWCSGLPFYLAWTFGGIHLLAAVPLLTALILLKLFWKPLGGEIFSISFFLLLPCFLWAAREGFQPGTQLADLLGLIAVWRIAKAKVDHQQRAFWTFGTFLIWSNFGTGPVWGLLWLLFSEWDGSKKAVQTPTKGKLREKIGQRRFTRSSVIGAAFLGGLLTPRGLWTWRDSILLLAPPSYPALPQESVMNVSETFWQTGCSLSILTFAALWGSVAVMKFAELWSMSTGERRFTSLLNSRRFWLSVLRSTFPVIAVLLSSQNIPLGAVWILLDHFQTIPRGTDGNHATHLREQFQRRQRYIACGFATIMLIAAGADASGSTWLCSERLGWGLSADLDLRLLNGEILETSDEPLVGWAPDGRSVGIGCWLDGHLQMADHPQRAYLGGRLHAHAALTADLLGAHRARYRREDGTWGGWVRQLADWNVGVLFVPARMQRLHQELSKSPWRPIDLDSPVVPYGSSENPRFSDMIVETIQQQGFVEFGPWQPTTQIYDSQGWRLDVIEMLGGGIDPTAAIRQSQFFRSINIPFASLRALLPVRNGSLSTPLLNEWRSCQIDVAYQEWMTFGMSSLFRQLVIEALTNGHAMHSQPWLLQQDDVKIEEFWQPCIEFYLQGQLVKAIESLPQETAQQRYATAMLFLELGDTQRASVKLDEVLTAPEDHSLKIAAEYWRQLLEQFASPRSRSE